MITVVIITLISWGGHRDFPDDSKWVFGCNVMISMICSRDSTRADWHCCHWRRCWWRRDLNEGQTTDTKAVRALLIKRGKTKLKQEASHFWRGARPHHPYSGWVTRASRPSRVCFSFASDWLRERREFSWPIKERTHTKPKQSRISFET